MKKLILFIISITLLFTLLLPTVFAQEPRVQPPPLSSPLNQGGERGVTVTSTVNIDPVLQPKIEAQLLSQWQDNSTKLVPFIVYLKEKADLRAARAQGDNLAKRAAIVTALQETAQRTQSRVMATLQQSPNRHRQSDWGQDVRSLWIINAVAARGSLDTILALAALPEVAVIRLDKEIKIDMGQPALLPLRQVNSAVPQWNISKIQADVARQTFNIDGHGVVVANVDTGVDWNHPAVQSNYRGYGGPGKVSHHGGNWYDLIQGATYPVDGNGHGTHTMGTMVGADGIGVAHGATWIAVRAFDSAGSGSTSGLHEAYQWLLAPNNDPTLAPNIVNNSWSNTDGSSMEFEPDVRLMAEADIYMVFAVGNEGSGVGTAGSPASLEIAFAVGATDINDDVTNFSGRGPSVWGQLKPEIAAPGKNVLSSLPGGTYGVFNGTSMATPHVAGLAALLLQASPALSQNLAQISYIITSTADPLAGIIPNNDAGWGRVNAYKAVAAVATQGILQGQVLGEITPLANTTLTFVTRGQNVTATTTTDKAGFYRQGLPPNSYDVTVWAFGYVPTTVYGIVITSNSSQSQDFQLIAEPQGTLFGAVRAKTTNQPLTATVTVDNTPLQISTDPANGNYRLNLPVGNYTLTIVAQGYRVMKQAISMKAGQNLTQIFRLDDAPTILLVDSGRWQQESKISYYQQALDALLYSYDTWAVKNPFTVTHDVPTAELLATYDIVIWSAPNDAPGYLDSDTILSNYLEQGGKLFISGQDIAYYDGGGSGFGVRDYLQNYLKVTYLQDTATSQGLLGVDDSPLAGLSLNLKGGDGANNQISPDLIANGDADFAAPLLYYDNGGVAGLYTGICVPYRAVFLAFGFESINQQAMRQTVMDKILTWLQTPASSSGLQISPPDSLMIGTFGSIVSQTIRLRNPGTQSDLYQLSLQGGNWPIVSTLPTPIQLDSCQIQTITVRVQINTQQWNVSDTLKISAQSTNNPTLRTTVTGTAKSPAPVLLVNDDRFYNFASQYQATMDNEKIMYDYWYVEKSWVGPVPPSPPLEVLQMYPIVVWYTGYDWITPLSTSEEERLGRYLDEGGRLFFSSQDYIYNLPNSRPSLFARQYLGIQKHTEDFSSTVVTGEADNPVGAYLGPYNLLFPPGYNNWTDAVEPSATAQVAMHGQAGQPNGLTNLGIGPTQQTWHTTFLAFGPELLTKPDRDRLMQRAVGWLSWVGTSTLTASTTTALSGETIAYTATIRNDGWSDLTAAHFTATFPSMLIPQPTSPELQNIDGQLVWQGALAKNASKTFYYTTRVVDNAPLGATAHQQSWFSYSEHEIKFDRISAIAINPFDLSQSTFKATPNQNVELETLLTYTLVLSNPSMINVPLVTVTSFVTQGLELLSADLPSLTDTHHVTWTVPIARQSAVTLTYQAMLHQTTHRLVDTVAYIDDGVHLPISLTARITVKQKAVYLPIIFVEGLEPVNQ